MGNYPDVIPGQKVVFSANRENEINHRLNAASGFRAGTMSGLTTPNVRLQAWNASGSAIQAGKVVNIAVTGSTMCGDAFPAVAFSDSEQPFGVLKSSLGTNEVGDLIMSGPASVIISGSTGSYAKPVSGGTFTRGDEGVKILNISGGTNAIIMLGDYFAPSSSPSPPSPGVTGFPDYFSPIEDRTVEMNTDYDYDVPVWLIGEIQSVEVGGELRGDLHIDISAGTHTCRIYLFDVYDSTLATEKVMVPVSLPIPANHTFRLGTVTDAPDLDMSIFPCL